MSGYVKNKDSAMEQAIYNRGSCKTPRGMGVSPMNHGQDAHATVADGGFCKSLNNKMLALRPGVSGFTLIEITMAIMVVSVGILAIMNLFVVGMDQGRRATMDDRMTTFGNSVLFSVRHNAEMNFANFSGDNINLATGKFWTASFAIKNPQHSLDLVGKDVFPLTKYDGGVFANGYLASAVFKNSSMTAMVDHAFRYSIFVNDVVITNAFSYTPNIKITNKSVFVYMFPGQFGTIKTGQAPFVCYTEMFNFETPTP